MTLYQLLNYVEQILHENTQGDEKELNALRARLYPGKIVAEDTSQLDAINAMRAEMGAPPLSALPGTGPRRVGPMTEEEQIAQIREMSEAMRRPRAALDPSVESGHGLEG